MVISMKTKNEEIEKIVGDYKFGFKTDAEEIFSTGKGLSLDVVKKISEYKGEPDWMKEIRIKAYNAFISMDNPKWGPDLSGIDFDEYTYYIKSSKRVEKSWDEVPDKIKDTFENYGYIMDTHTAVGKNVYDQYLFETGDMTKSVILSTASPYKFNRSVMKALCKEQGFDDKSEFDLTDILCKKTGLAIPKSLKELKSKEIRFKDSIKKEDLKEFICNKLLS